jgi:hypothetical protein
MEICMQTLLLSLMLNLVLSVGNVMLPIEDLMVDGGCIATTGGRRLFCKIIFIYTYIYIQTRIDATQSCIIQTTMPHARTSIPVGHTSTIATQS